MFIIAAKQWKKIKTLDKRKRLFLEKNQPCITVFFKVKLYNGLCFIVEIVVFLKLN